jgi:hypothetical protein
MTFLKILFASSFTFFSFVPDINKVDKGLGLVSFFGNTGLTCFLVFQFLKLLDCLFKPPLHCYFIKSSMESPQK